uniref:Uncharacterized protein n=1 Tax=Tanacetum cinerariifolium TaxID=118510 RepID=A0A6L2L4H2_TANCI|nr:hypothetical protein [Tanacetum cinerariifolium]
MERKIDEWSKSQNVSLEQTERTEPPTHPQARTEHVNDVFTGRGKSDHSSKIQKDPPPPIILNNKIEKDRPIKTSEKGYHVNIGIGIKLYEWAVNLVALKLLPDHHLLDRSEISFDCRVTVGFGSISGGLDHVNHVIRLPLKHGLSKILWKVDHPNHSVGTDQEIPTASGGGPGGPRYIWEPPLELRSFFVFLRGRLILASVVL